MLTVSQIDSASSCMMVLGYTLSVTHTVLSLHQRYNHHRYQLVVSIPVSLVQEAFNTVIKSALSRIPTDVKMHLIQPPPAPSPLSQIFLQNLQCLS